MTTETKHKRNTRKHALLSASGANRWLNCTPSARLGENIPDNETSYAAAGELAHSIAELKVRKKFVTPTGPQKFNHEMDKLKKDPMYAPEMESCTNDYLDYISGVTMKYDSAPYVAVEVMLDYGDYVPGGFGTGDCIVIGNDTLHVIDFKFGKGVPVSVENNPQLKLYGLGALKKYGLLYQITDVELTIFQPRAAGDTVKEWSIPADKLIEWGENIKPIAKKA